MRVALVACDAFQNRSTGYYPPLHLCHLATGLELAGCEVKIFDYAGPFSEMGGYDWDIGEPWPWTPVSNPTPPEQVPAQPVKFSLQEFVIGADLGSLERPAALPAVRRASPGNSERKRPELPAAAKDAAVCPLFDSSPTSARAISKSRADGQGDQRVLLTPSPTSVSRGDPIQLE